MSTTGARLCAVHNVVRRCGTLARPLTGKACVSASIGGCDGRTLLPGENEGGVISRHGVTEPEALHDPALQLLKERQLLVGFHALSTPSATTRWPKSRPSARMDRRMMVLLLAGLMFWRKERSTLSVFTGRRRR